MEPGSSQRTLWSSKEVYALSIICLLIGIPVGYLFRPPSNAAAVNVSRTAPAQHPPAALAQADQEELKHLADKRAEPLIALLKSKPNDPAVLAEIGNRYAEASQHKTAILYYERSLGIKPRNADALTELGNSYYFLGDSKKALELYDRALKVDPKWASALFNLGMAKWQVQADPKGAVATWQKLLDTNPNHPRRGEVEMFIARAKQQIH